MQAYVADVLHRSIQSTALHVLGGIVRYIESYIHHNRIGVLVELEIPDQITALCSEFTDLARDIAMHIAATNPTGLDKTSVLNVIPVQFRAEIEDISEEALLEQAWIRDPSITVRELIENVSSILKTPIRVTRFCRYDANDS